MTVKLFSIFDSAAKTFSQPHPAQNRVVAIRNFRHLVNDPETQVFKSPQDFSMYEIGEFSDGDGMIVPCAPELVVSALSLKDPA